MGFSAPLAQVIPFPSERVRTSTDSEKSQFKRALSQDFHKQLTELEGVTLYGIGDAGSPIDRPFIAQREHSVDSGILSRVSSSLPTKDHYGSHEIKIVGGEKSGFFLFELTEPPTVRSERSIPELLRVAEQRLTALRTLDQLDPPLITARRVHSVIEQLALHREPFEVTPRLRWIGSATPEGPNDPGKMVTVEMQLGALETRIDFDQYPYAPTHRSYKVATERVLPSLMGGTLLYDITETFLNGEQRGIHLRFDTDMHFRPVEEE